MRCPICGTRNKADALECVACGSALNTAPSAPEEKNGDGKSSEQKRDVSGKTASGKTASRKNTSSKQGKKKTKMQDPAPSEQAEASTEETKEEKIYEDGLIPVVIINAQEKSHIPMNIDYSLESEKFLEEEEDDEEEEDGDDGLFWRKKQKRPIKPLISGSDTLIYVCMGVLGFLLVFAISYLAINIVLKDMEKDPSGGTNVGLNTTDSSSEEPQTSTEDSSSDSSETSTEEQESLYTGEPWLWEEKAWIQIVNSEAHLIQYIGSEAVVRIPQEYEGYPLTTIDAKAFENCSGIAALEIPEGVTYIGDYGLAGCTGLKVIALPETLLSMGEHALDGVENLSIISPGNSYGFQLGLQQNYHWIWGSGLPQDVSQWVEEEPIPSSEEPTETPPASTPEPPTDPPVTEPPATDPPAPPSVPDDTYYESDIIYRVIGGVVTIVKYRGGGGVVQIPSEYKGCPVRYIGDAAFQGSTNVTHIIVPDSVVSIGYHGMSDMVGCVLVTIPSSVSAIDDSAFEDSGAVIIKSPAGSFAESYCKSHPPLVWQEGYGL